MKIASSAAARTTFFQAFGLLDETDRSESRVMKSIATSMTMVTAGPSMR